MPDERLPKEHLAEFLAALFDAWSLQSSSLWTAENPAAGHCGVTALVANDMFGGKICKTPHGDVWHFYNLIDDQRLDFTESQFGKPLLYSDVASDRVEAFSDTNAKQYAHLRKAICRSLGAPY